MDVGRADLERAFEDLVDGADDRRAARQVLQRLDRVGVDELVGELGGGGVLLGVAALAADPLEQQVELLEGEDAELRHRTECQRDGLDRDLGAGVGHRQPQLVADMEGQYEGLAQKLQREALVAQRHLGHGLVVAARQVVELAGEAGEVGRRRATTSPGGLEFARLGADVAARLAVRHGLDAARAQKLGEARSEARVVRHPAWSQKSRT